MEVVEYVRDGMDFKLFEINLKHYIEETPSLRLNIMSASLY